jgi:hypothetical protein
VKGGKIISWGLSGCTRAFFEFYRESAKLDATNVSANSASWWCEDVYASVIVSRFHGPDAAKTTTESVNV